MYKDASSQVHTLRRMVKEKDEAIQKQGDLEKKIQALEMRKNPGGVLSSAPPLLPGGEGGTGMANGTGSGPAGHDNVGGAPGVPSPPPPPLAAGSGKQSSQPQRVLLNSQGFLSSGLAL